MLENSFVPKNLRDTLRETFKGLVRSPPPQSPSVALTGHWLLITFEFLHNFYKNIAVF